MSPSERRPQAIAVAVVVIAVTLLLLDLVFLGVVMKPVYDELLGPLRRKTVYWPAGLMFYAMYVTVVLVHAVLPARSIRDALRRGAGLGFVAYATYELTNWAVLQNWPARLVPIDLLWGVVLTSIVAGAGRAAYRRMVR